MFTNMMINNINHFYIQQINYNKNRASGRDSPMHINEENQNIGARILPSFMAQKPSSMQTKKNL